MPFPEFFRRRQSVLFEEFGEIRIISKIKLEGNFRNTQIGIHQQSFGFEHYPVPYYFACRFAYQFIADGIQMIGRDEEQGGIIFRQFFVCIMFIDQLPEVIQGHLFLVGNLFFDAYRVAARDADEQRH